MKPRITVIGSSNADMIMKLPRLPGRGETVTDGQFVSTFGGKGANQAVAAARAGADVKFLTCVDTDVLGQAMVDNFVRDGIDTRHVLRTSDAPSGAALVMFDSNGENYLAVAPGSNYCIRPAHIDDAREAIAGSDMLVMQMEIPADTTLRALEAAAKVNVPVLFNFAPVRTRDVPLSALMTGLVVNEVEAHELSGMPVRTPEDAQRAARHLLNMGPKFVVVTLGRDGACAASAEGAFRVRSIPVQAVDTTGAGDTFCGALAVALAEGQPLPLAMRFATAAAAVSVTIMGAQPSIPPRNSIESTLARFDSIRST
ncbi:MAG TPA: ribokinase [Tepidisphaeraceae bacterium]|jgi:ribokinase|nr:ribokinase [Tepidisphaeraceae bacterium]